MRPTHYLRHNIATGVCERLPFDASHYRSAGFDFLQSFPVLEAHQLVNRWNVSQVVLGYIYALEA